MNEKKETGNAGNNWGLDVSIWVTPLSRRALLPVWLCDCLVGALGVSTLLALSAVVRWF